MYNISNRVARSRKALGTKLGLARLFYFYGGKMRLKKPLNYDEQIKRLEERGILVENSRRAKRVLKRINYYRFTGYALQFRINPGKSEYREGTCFDNIFKIILFDEKLRNVIRKYIEKVEIYYRTLISNKFAESKCKSEPYDQHLDRNNFYNKKGYDAVMESFNKEKNYYRESLVVRHHKNRYEGKMPLWVMVELMSFSNLSKLYSAMYISEKQCIAKEEGISYKTLENHLRCLSILRNKCAHAARLYNTVFNPPAKLNTDFLKHNPDVKNNSLFAYLLILMKRLPTDNSKKNFLKELDRISNEYKKDIDISLIGFTTEYLSILKNNL